MLGSFLRTLCFGYLAGVVIVALLFFAADAFSGTGYLGDFGGVIAYGLGGPIGAFIVFMIWALR